MKNFEFNKFREKIGKCWKSNGNYCFQLETTDDLLSLVVYPAIRQIYGGEKDGLMKIFAFSFNINKFRRIFDSNPEITFFSDINLSFINMVGTYNFKNLNVLICSTPPKNSKPHEIFFTVGPKKGMIEENIS